jgi:hypothetical protein
MGSPHSLAAEPLIRYIMNNETSAGSAGAPDRGRHSQSGPGNSSPLQTRAQFLKNWDWQSVTGINRGACERGRAQHGTNSETHQACAESWQTARQSELTLVETFDLLRSFHRRAPFLFFNGNTFSAIGRELTLVLFQELPPLRKREAASAVAHYIAGVLDRDSMISIVDSLAESADLKPGDHVKTFRGTSRGTILRLLEDGRVVWRSDNSNTELIALPETLVKINRPK